MACSKYLLLISFLNFIYYFEIVGFRMLLFPHLVTDINPDTAQKNFAIGQCLYRLIPLLTNFFCGMFVDKTGMSRGMLFVFIVIKMVYLVVYVITTNVYLIMVVLVLAGFTNGIQAISMGELKRNVQENKVDIWLNLVMLLSCMGGLLAGLMHLIPKHIKITISTITITQETMIFFVIEVIYFIYLPLFLWIKRPPPTEKIVYVLLTDTANEPMDTSSQRAESDGEISTNNRYKILGTSFLYAFNVALIWELGAFSCVEYTKKLSLPSYTVGMFFTFRYFIAGIFNRIFSYYLVHINPSVILTTFISVRELCLVLMIISSFLSRLYLSITLFSVANIILSMMHFFDQSTVQQILWRCSSNISVMAILISSAKSSGYMFAFTIPMCFNFIELIQGISFVLLAINHVLFVNTRMV